MARQLQIKQVSGLRAELDGRVQTASNLSGTGYGVFNAKVDNDLRFYRIHANNGLTASLAGNTITIGADLGVGANQMVVLDGNGRYPAADGRNITTLNPAQLQQNGTLPLAALTLPQNNIYIGDINSRPLAAPTGNVPISSWGAATANLDLAGYKITTSASSWATNELVPRSYVDAIAQGVKWKSSVKVATVAAINLGSPGSVIDGVSMTMDARVLVKDQGTLSQNGVYLWKGSSAAMVRADDADAGSEIIGMAVFVEEGTHADEGWLLVTDAPITVGVTNLVYTGVTGVADIGVAGGLEKVAKDLRVLGDGYTIGLYAGTVIVRSNAVPGMPLVSSGTDGTPASWGPLNIASSTLTTGTLPFDRGGTGRTTAAQHSVFGAVTQNNIMELVTLGTYSVLGRLDSNMVSISNATLRELTNTRQQTDTGNALSGSMTLMALSQTPLSASRVNIYYNGLRLTHNVDYTISGTTVTATNALNISYGGSGSDGLGFINSDTIDAEYEY